MNKAIHPILFFLPAFPSTSVFIKREEGGGRPSLERGRKRSKDGC